MAISLIKGDCLVAMRDVLSDSLDACVTDPPYGLSFMDKNWDHGVPGIPFWREVYRVLKPGAHIVAFGGTRTYHRMACAIEDAGFEIRDSLMWVYGTGFPKNHSMRDISRPELGTALKPAFEPIVLARKPLSEKTVAANVLRWGAGALNIDGCRVATDLSVDDPGLGGNGSWTTSKAQSGDTVSLPRGTVASSALGRWPANVVHDGSDEVVGAFPSARSSGNYNKKPKKAGPFGSSAYGEDVDGSVTAAYGDSGSAARFFYSAKASRADRAGSKHPTVKPISLMQWLARLVTPPGGTVLDPFAGSGTTGAACEREGFDCILIEKEAEYQRDIETRMRLPVQASLDV